MISSPNARHKTIFMLGLQLCLLAGCSTNPADDAAGTAADGGWVRDIAGKPHTHRVRLPGCGWQVITHTHQGDQAGIGLHKHNGCLVCPPKNTGVKRIH